MTSRHHFSLPVACGASAASIVIGLLVCACSDATSSAPPTPPVVITVSATLPAAVRSIAYATALTARGGDGVSYAWKVASGTLPGGLTLTTDGVLSGIPTTAGANSFSVEVASGGQTATKTLSLTVGQPAVVITSLPPLPDGTRGVSYADTLHASGGDGENYAWSTTAGNVPAGLELSGSGVLSGIPVTAGVDTFGIVASSGGQSDSVTLSLTIHQPQVTITTISPLQDATRGVAYSDTLRALGGDDSSYVWSVVAGSLPSGLQLSPRGVLGGTPTAAGINDFTVQTTSAGIVASKPLVLTVANPPVSITTQSPLPEATVGQTYSDTLRAIGGDGISYGWNVVSGIVPQGLSLSPNGVLSGVPTVAVVDTFDVEVGSGGVSAQMSLSLSVVQPPPTCTSFSIAPTSTSVGADGGSGTVNVSADSGCTWTSESNNGDWLTLTSGGSGTGTGTVAYSVRSNTTVNGGTNSRAGTLTIAGNTFDVEQAGQKCTFALGVDSVTWGPDGGTGSLSVTVSTGCQWTTKSNDNWITVTSPSSQNGNAVVSYAVASNLSTNGSTIPRSGSIQIGDQSLSVTQRGTTKITVYAAQDAAVSTGSPTANFDGQNLPVYYYAGTPGEAGISLVQFDLSGIPANATIVGAYLYLNTDLTAGGSPAGNVVVSVQPAYTAWSESSVTANTLPGLVGSPVSLGPITQQGEWYVRVGNIVQAWHQGTYQNHGLELFTLTNQGFVRFLDSENGGTSGPKLVLWYY